MKKRLSPFCIALTAIAALFADGNTSQAQIPRLGDQVQDPGTFRRVASDIQVGWPGRMWVSTDLADQGLGYQGSYLTVGGKSRLFEDFLDGRWLTEARLHHSLEDSGGFFANVGIERVFSVDAADADVVMGAWYDFDGDDQGNFGHDFNQVGINAAIKSKKFDVIGNGYFPVGNTDFTSGDVSGVNGFLGNNILLVPGIDSALEGFDVTLRLRPKQLAFGNGTFDIGGYSYRSDTIDSFGGGRLRLGFQSQRGIQISGEINHDERFDTTGAVNIGYAFGGPGARSAEYSSLGRDFEETVRNDHIVRFNQDVVLAIDPDTGAAYNVVHVDNLANAASSDGSVENPYTNLADAQTNSNEGDVVFVQAGDGTSTGLDTGIMLKDDQLLLGAGSDVILPIQDGRLFRLQNADAAAPTLTNPFGDEVVKLANNNLVAGIQINADGASAGIAGTMITDGQIQNTTVNGSDEYGIELERIRGEWSFTGNTLTNNNIDGLLVRGSSGDDTTFVFENNTANNNGFEGIHLENYNASSVMLTNNRTNLNGRHGLYLERTPNTRTEVDIIGHVSRNNAASGIIVERGDGNLNILNAQVTDNAANGVEITNWSNTLASDTTFIGDGLGGTTTISRNGIAGGSNLAIIQTDEDVSQFVTITGLTLDEGGRGIFAESLAAGSTLDLRIVDNVSISNNIADGIRLAANNGGILNAMITNDNGVPLILNDNSQVAGAAISLFADNAPGAATSQINAIVRNVSIDDSTGDSTSNVVNPFNSTGFAVEGTNNSRINLSVDDSTIRAAVGVAVDIDNDGSNQVNNIYLRNLTIRSDAAVFVNSDGGTYLDFLLSDSDLQSNGATFDPTADPTNAPFLGAFGDSLGDTAVFINATGDFGGDLDNLTRVQLTNNLIRDWTFDAVEIQTTGDAQMLAYVVANEILNNGPGQDNDPNNDNVPNRADNSNAECRSR